MASLASSQTGLIESFEQIQEIRDRDAPVVTMYSGGLDSSYLLLRLHELGFKNVHAIAVNLGAPIDEGELKRLAAHFGATFTCLDGRDAFIENVRAAIRAHANYLGNYPISSSLSRPVIASLVVEHAKTLHARLLLHTATLSQNSLPRLNNGIQRSRFCGLFGSLYVRSIVSREQKAKELAEAGLDFMVHRSVSGDENLWCREFESGPLDDPEEFSIPEDAFRWTKSGGDRKPENIKLGFKNGNLVSVNGEERPLIELIALLNDTVGKFGHGRYAGLEHLYTDQKVLEVREAPAAKIIFDALFHLETASLSTKAILLKKGQQEQWVQETVSGRWGSEVHTECDRAMAVVLEGVSGTVTYRLVTTHLLPCSIIAENPRYVRNRDDWERNTAAIGAPPVLMQFH